MKRRAPLALLVVFAAQLAAADLVVTNATDVANGNTSTPAALVANPGADGISLREALTACNNAPGPHTITFAAALAGQSIQLGSPLVISQDGTSLSGLVDANNEPAITLNGGNPRMHAMLFVLASDVLVSGLQFTGQGLDALSVLAGQPATGSPQPRQIVRRVRIVNNTFTRPLSDLTPTGSAVRVTMEPGAGSVGAVIEDVSVNGNRFVRYADGVGVEVAANGSGCVVRNVSIEDNVFTEMYNGIDVDTAAGSMNQVVGTRILRNAFVGGYPQPTVGIGNIHDPLPNTGGSIDDTLLAGNRFSGAANVTIVGGQDDVHDSAVTNTVFVNNVFTPGSSITIEGGTTDAVGNRIAGVRFINNTLALDRLTLAVNQDRASGNTLTGVTFTNTIFSDRAILNGLSQEMVSYSIISKAGFAGVNGNLAADPNFVDAANSDYHLRAGSPAIDAGTSDGAPTTDLEGRPRFDDPATPNTGAGAAKFFDLGAYEFAPVSTQGRLVNLSILTSLTAAGDTFTVGMVLGGAVTGGVKPLLVRAAGPSLAPFGVANPLADPRLDLFSGVSVAASNDNWGGGAVLAAAFAQAGAFAFSPATSRDAALAYSANLTAASANYTVQVGGNGGTGAALAEIYDATPPAAFTLTTPRLLNVSVLKNVGPGLTVGFVVGGTTPVKVLARAVGPSLGPLFGVNGAMADPKLELFDGTGKSLATNNDWGGTATLVAAFTQVGAFALDPASKDAALVATLSSGSYTVQVTPASGATGVALVEIYELP